MPKHHELKILERYAIEEKKGIKPWELRKNDRDFKEGDSITFTVIRYTSEEEYEEVGKYSRQITFILEGGIHGLEDNYVIMTLGNLTTG